ncbi:MAG: YifB family Mg chelatase-like AAA ATPase, partial [Leptospira sp.]|nr:YifB family Mg chelatase-like AAA ATPase [Leptospira sp.]
MNSGMSYFYSANLEGFDAKLVKVEVNLKRGIPRFIVVGLPATSIKESTDRVRIAIENSGYDFPLQNILVNLAPAGARKDGSWFDLPIALGILAASDQIQASVKTDEFLILGELGLDGRVKPLKGLINMLLSLRKSCIKSVIVPEENKYEASLIPDLNIFAISHILDLKTVLNGTKSPEPFRQKANPHSDHLRKIRIYKDQAAAFRALEIAVAGKHHLLLIGTPGTGKSMIAKLSPILQPQMSDEEFLEVLRIRSINELVSNQSSLSIRRPFRCPHHTSSDISIVGGGSDPRMGEVTLSHNGILFLDELGEFKPSVIQSLREPMEEGFITVSRVRGHITYPASFLLICATNPCPCGYFNSEERTCFCSSAKVKSYLTKFSGPFLDRIDLEIEIKASGKNKEAIEIDLNESSNKIQRAKLIQEERYRGKKYQRNGMIPGDDLDHYFVLDIGAEKIWTRIRESPMASIRKLNIIRKVARTIADMQNSELIQEE